MVKLRNARLRGGHAPGHVREAFLAARRFEPSGSQSLTSPWPHERPKRENAARNAPSFLVEERDVGNVFEESILGHGRCLENCTIEIERAFHWRWTADCARLRPGKSAATKPTNA
jgi:hypothetical protein